MAERLPAESEPLFMSRYPTMNPEPIPHPAHPLESGEQSTAPTTQETLAPEVAAEYSTGRDKASVSRSPSKGPVIDLDAPRPTIEAANDDDVVVVSDKQVLKIKLKHSGELVSKGKVFESVKKLYAKQFRKLLNIHVSIIGTGLLRSLNDTIKISAHDQTSKEDFLERHREVYVKMLNAVKRATKKDMDWKLDISDEICPPSDEAEFDKGILKRSKQRHRLAEGSFKHCAQLYQDLLDN